MLQPGFHVKNHHIRASQHQMADNSFEHHMLRTYASSSPGFHRAQDEKLYAVSAFCIFIRNVVYLRVQTEQLIELIRAGPFLHQLPHLGNRYDLLQLLFRKAKGQSKIRIGIRIRRQYAFSPSSAYILARVAANVVLPTPPFPVIAIFIVSLLRAARKPR